MKTRRIRAAGSDSPTIRPSPSTGTCPETATTGPVKATAWL
ncbi:hypothetical protein [Kitasatospora terrestris]